MGACAESVTPGGISPIRHDALHFGIIQKLTFSYLTSQIVTDRRGTGDVPVFGFTFLSTPFNRRLSCPHSEHDNMAEVSRSLCAHQVAPAAAALSAFIRIPLTLMPSSIEWHLLAFSSHFCHT
ncbi:Hypothetical protein NTJ_12969 [Nesidiocoris tenuis]|uniref:Uncharacterized protein n=1 Tax=Nesidiocoris tenuis TaxID=355587 RepID=A0ABN7B6X5_9HEMI|nr:Hypothetical protein NTJ_12969 [Nesidiocoris tenuis]